MKIIALISSYRKNGNTARLVQVLKDQIRTISAQRNIQTEFETVFLGQANLQICRGCRICFDQGEEKCPLRDDLLAIKAKLTQADFIILASPVYVEDVNGIMKNWIDRMAFHCHRPEFAGKAAYVLSTSGAGSTSHTLTTMKNALRTWGFAIAGQATFRTGALMRQEEIVALYQEKTRRIAEKIINGMESKTFLKPIFLSLLFFTVQQRFYINKQADHSIDYTYWTGKGWLDPSCHYYTNYKLNPVKVSAARFLGFIIAKFVLK